MTKHLLYINFIFLPFLGISQNWIQKASFGGASRYAAGSFSINGKGYIGIGRTGIGVDSRDFWEYDPGTDAWTQKANFGGTARRDGASFAIGNLGYIGAGTDSPGPFVDFWEYNPTNNSWTQRANYPGSAQNGVASFSIGTKGYVGLGIQPGGAVVKDFWEWDGDPSSPNYDTWTRKADFGGAARYAAQGMAISGKGYIGLGVNGTNNTWFNDFWEYDPSGDSWTQKTNFGGTGREQAISFVIQGNGRGYMGTGYSGSTSQVSDIWEYNPVGDSWAQICNFGGGVRHGAVAFVVNDVAYVGTGWNGSFNNDLWELQQVCGGALPIELLSFSAKWEDESYNAALIKWETANEINNDYFEIERSIDAINFSSIAQIKGSNNGNQINTYQELDLNPYTDGVSYYRLKQTDYDGTFSYSQIDILNIPEGLEIINLYPNPVEHNGHFLLLSSLQTAIDVQIINSLGQVVQSESIEISIGVNTLDFASDKLKNGNYFLKIMADNKYQVQRKFIVNRNKQ